MSRKFFIKVTYSFEYSSFGLLETAERLLLHPDKKMAKNEFKEQDKYTYLYS